MFLEGEKSELKKIESVVAEMIITVNKKGFIDENDVEIDYDNPPVREKINGNKQLIMKLRQIDYCDVDGNEKKILVFASEPFEIEP